MFECVSICHWYCPLVNQVPDIDQVKNKKVVLYLVQQNRESSSWRYFSHTSLISLSFTTILFMISTQQILESFSMCFEGFLFGNVSVLCALTCNLAISFAQKVQLFTVLGVYSGIFAIYLQWTSDESRTLTANVVFYAICLLYVFCAATVVGDFISYIVQVSNKFSICKSIIFIISCAVMVVYQFTIASTSNRLTANIKSHGGCPSHI